MIRSGLALLLCATPVAAQERPPVGIVNAYGARALTAERVLETAGISVGDTVTEQDKLDAVARLLALPNVRDAHIAIVCCENGSSIAYVGVLEAGSAVTPFAAAPTGQARLPGNVVRDEAEFMKHLQEAVQQNQTEEDDSAGHSFVRYAPAREVQQRFAQYALGNVHALRDVLRTSSDAHHRAIAAQVMAYAVNKSAVVADLVSALRDPDATVRNNATRALAVMASWAAKNPDVTLRIPHAPFVAMLNSPVWSDLNKASFVLMSLTQSRDPAIMRDLRATALPALADMARWQAFGHAFPAGLILGRLAGIPEAEIMAAFQKDREALIEAARLGL
ncbi:MAG TPA: HEAT repeat domain-containing protein [Longimicrobiales bacterium]